jgi:hypothetical protein
MATQKQSTASKVRNTQVSFKNGKNEKAESLMKRSFEPLFSPKDGKARLTFCGVEHSVIEWTDNGKDRIKPVIKLVFSCFDVTHESPANIAVTCEYRLSEKNRLGQILTVMGYEFKKETVNIDNDDEFGTRVKHTDPSEIFDFLRGQCGLVFKGNLAVPIRKNKAGERVERVGLWDIDYKTLELKLLKTGEQERDMLASDISDEDFEKPEIEMSSDSD